MSTRDWFPIQLCSFSFVNIVVMPEVMLCWAHQKSKQKSEAVFCQFAARLSTVITYLSAALWLLVDQLDGTKPGLSCILTFACSFPITCLRLLVFAYLNSGSAFSGFGAQNTEGRIAGRQAGRLQQRQALCVSWSSKALMLGLHPGFLRGDLYLSQRCHVAACAHAHESWSAHTR